jgi:hypothetical protein
MTIPEAVALVASPLFMHALRICPRLAQGACF